jgi:hypothetical protein
MDRDFVSPSPSAQAALATSAGQEGSADDLAGAASAAVISPRALGAARVLPIANMSRNCDEALMDIYDDLNMKYFDEVLPRLPVCRIIPDNTALVDLNGLTRLRVLEPGDSGRVSMTIYLSKWLFETPAASEEIRRRMIANTVLHEMVHVALYLDALGGAHPLEDGHGFRFAAECNRIGGQARWGLVEPSGQSVDELEDSAAWPDNAIENPAG